MSNCKKRTFAQRVKFRNLCLWATLAAMLVNMAVVGEFGLGDSRLMTPLMETVSKIIFFGGLILLSVELCITESCILINAFF